MADAQSGRRDPVDFERVLGSTGPAAEQLSARFERLISEGQLRPGEKLPPERELAELTGVSRNTVREALWALEFQGLISRKPGRGSVVEPVRHDEFKGRLAGNAPPTASLLEEVMDLRSAVEPPIAERAAARARPWHISDLANILERSEAEIGTGSPSAEVMVQLDIEFHTLVARASGNELLIHLLKVANDWMSASRHRVLQGPKRFQQSAIAHRRIFEAIESGDPERARFEMLRHLAEVSETVNSSRPPEVR